MPIDLDDEVLALFGEKRPELPEDALHTLLTKRLGRVVDSSQLTLSLQSLMSRGLVELTNKVYLRREPDFAEERLEDPIESFLISENGLQDLRLSRIDTVIQRTARGGRLATGIWSRPDFTIATVRRRKYDPLRHLDVIAFELKNRSGTSVVAVHEALAHCRFAHYAYVVIPTSVLRQSVQKQIESSCTEHGIGLIAFDLGSLQDGTPRVRSFEFVVRARRHNPDPDVVDKYIDDRFGEAQKRELLSIAGQ